MGIEREFDIKEGEVSISVWKSTVLGDEDHLGRVSMTGGHVRSTVHSDYSKHRSSVHFGSGLVDIHFFPHQPT